MPQRQFWAQQLPCRVRFELHENPLKADADPTLTMTIFDQEGATMERQAASVPTGFVPWALHEVVLATMEAYEAATPKDAVSAFKRTCAAWREDVRQLGLHT